MSARRSNWRTFVTRAKPVMRGLGLAVMIGAAVMVAVVLILGGLGAISVSQVFMPAFAVFWGCYIIGALLYMGGV